MDIRNLEQVKSFAAFLDVLTNPEQYRKLIEDAGKVVEEIKTVSGVYSNLEEVRAWKRKLDVQYQDADKELEKAYADLEREKDKVEEARVELDAKTAKQELYDKQRDVALNAREDAVKVLEARLVALAGKEKALQRSLQAVEEHAKELKIKEDALRSALR